MSVRLRHVGIVCKDIDEVLPSYKRLGMQVVYDAVEKVRIVKLDGGIELLQYESMSETVLRQRGISHIAFTQDGNGNYIEVVTNDKNS